MYQKLARLVGAINSCEETSNPYLTMHEANLQHIQDEYFPSGSGFDGETSLDTDISHPERLVFNSSYHIMKDGFYDGWVEFTVAVNPSLAQGFKLTVKGKFAKNNDLKEYIHETFSHMLDKEV